MMWLMFAIFSGSKTIARDTKGRAKAGTFHNLAACWTATSTVTGSLPGWCPPTFPSLEFPHGKAVGPEYWLQVRAPIATATAASDVVAATSAGAAPGAGAFTDTHAPAASDARAGASGGAGGGGAN